MKTLTEIAEQYRTDKVGSIGHNYVSYYETLFKDPTAVHNVLEIGIGYPELMVHVPDYITGASLYMWRDYFPNAQIIGVDNNVDVLVEDDRIWSLSVDQSRISDLISLRDGIPMQDLIVDDGSHKTEDQILTMLVLCTHVEKEGYYIIEDVKEPDRIVEKVLDGFTYEVKEFNHTGGIDDRLVILQWKK